MSLANLRNEAVQNLSGKRYAAIETLLAMWASGHLDHIDQIHRVFGCDIPWNVNRYQCFADGVKIDIRTDMAMDGNMLNLTVTSITSSGAALDIAPSAG